MIVFLITAGPFAWVAILLVTVPCAATFFSTFGPFRLAGDFALGLKVGIVVFDGKVPGGMSGDAVPITVLGAKIVWCTASSSAMKSPPRTLLPEGK